MCMQCSAPHPSASGAGDLPALHRGAQWRGPGFEPSTGGACAAGADGVARGTANRQGRVKSYLSRTWILLVHPKLEGFRLQHSLLVEVYSTKYLKYNASLPLA